MGTRIRAHTSSVLSWRCFGIAAADQAAAGSRRQTLSRSAIREAPADCSDRWRRLCGRVGVGGEGGSGFGIYGQRYAANGAKAGGEFRVNATTAADQRQPAVAGLSGGGFRLWLKPCRRRRRHLASATPPLGQSRGASSGSTPSSGNQPLPRSPRSSTMLSLWFGPRIPRMAQATASLGNATSASGVKQGPEFRVNTFTLEE